MSKNVLKVISDSLDDLGIEYGFGVYTADPIVYPYFVGEYQETESMTEDGLQESTFILTGFSRDTWMTLEDAKETIETYFTQEGTSFMATDGSAVVVAYGDAMIVPKDDAELKSIQINLTIKEWKVN